MNENFKSLLNKYGTVRIDIQNFGEDYNNFIIIKNSDSNSKIHTPNWFNEYGKGVVIESYEGILDLKIKCIHDGLLKIWIKGPDIRDIHKHKFPVYIDLTKFSVNDEVLIENNMLLWHEKDYKFSKNVFDSEIVDIHIEWLPFNEDTEFNIDDSHVPLLYLKEKLHMREKQINSVPQLSSTTLGSSALNGKLIYRNWVSFDPSRTLMRDLNGYCENIWFTRYLKYKFPDEDFKINIFSVANAHDNLSYPMVGKKVLYTAEDLNYRYLEMKFRFDKYALDYVDLAMGYDVIDNPKYLRFPYWLLTHFSPEITEEEIEKKIEMWNSTTYKKTKDAVIVAGHDNWGTRTLITKDIESYLNITYAGRWKNNTDELWNKYNNDKDSFLNQFKFNICPENLLDDAYVTEKIFDAIKCDCIPLYAGGGNYLEPKVLNHDAIIKWEGNEEQSHVKPNLEKNAYMGLYEYYPVRWVAEDNQNLDSIELIKNLLSDEKTYNEFKDQDKLLNSSTKYIISIFSELEKHFERLIYS